MTADEEKSAAREAAAPVEMDTLASAKAAPPPRRSFLADALDRYFRIAERGSTVTTEIIAGTTTFLAIAYTLLINPVLLCPGGPNDPYAAARAPSILVATCFVSVLGNALMATVANVPFGMAPVMSWLSRFSTLMANGVDGGPWTYDNAMALCFVYSAVLLIVNFAPAGHDDSGNAVAMREKIFDSLPSCVLRAIPAGVGLFNTWLGFRKSGLLMPTSGVLVTFADFTALFSDSVPQDIRNSARQALSCIMALIAICLLMHFRVPGAIVIGITIGTIFAIPLGVADLNILAGKGGVSWRFWENFANYFTWDSARGGVFCSCFRGFDFLSFASFASLCFQFAIADLFDTLACAVGCADPAGLTDERERPRAHDKIIYADGLAAVASPLLGISCVSVLAESTSGILMGGRTGLVALVIAVYFAISLFIAPIFAFIPVSVSSAAVIYGGLSMVPVMSRLDFGDLREGLPGFLTLMVMAWSSSIPKGIAFGTLAYVVVFMLEWVINLGIWVVRGRMRDEPLPEWPISLVTLVISAVIVLWLFVIKE